jgi:dolichyl-phosphate beta-glucosyltransferase
MNEPLLSLVLPVYNGAPFLRQSLSSVTAFARSQPFGCEIIVSDDGSRDGTGPILAEFADSLSVLTCERNRGKGHAVRRGVLAATGRCVVFTDADLPYGLDLIPSLIADLDDNRFDLVVGSRDARPDRERSPQRFLRRAASRAFSTLVAHSLATGVSDTQCGLKAFRRPAARDLFERSRIDGFAFDVEILFLARARGLRLKLLPLQPARKPFSTVRLLRDAPRMVLDVARIRWNRARGRYRLADQAP